LFTHGTDELEGVSAVTGRRGKELLESLQDIACHHSRTGDGEFDPAVVECDVDGNVVVLVVLFGRRVVVIVHLGFPRENVLTKYHVGAS
jgi:hypothetical protein